MYRVTVTQKVMDTSRLNPYFTIQKALTKKKIANDIFQNEFCHLPDTSEEVDSSHAMKRAIRLYTNSANLMENLLQGTYFQNVEEDHPQRNECRTILIDSLNNITAVYLRQKEYHEAKLSAVQVLTVDPNNIKALLRAAKSSLLDPASDFEEASAATKAAESAIANCNKNKSLNEKELKLLRRELKTKQLDYKEKNKEMFGSKIPALKKNVDSTTATCMPDILTPGENEDTDASFWKNQIMYGMLPQVVFPLLIFFIYRYFYNNTDQTDKT